MEVSVACNNYGNWRPVKSSGDVSMSHCMWVQIPALVCINRSGILRVDPSFGIQMELVCSEPGARSGRMTDSEIRHDSIWHPHDQALAK